MKTPHLMSLWLRFKHFTHHTKFLGYFKVAEMTLSEFFFFFASSWKAEKKVDIHGEKFLDLRFKHANKSPVSFLREALVVSLKSQLPQEEFSYTMSIKHRGISRVE